MRRTAKGGELASPPFSLACSGPCIVAGAAWCLHDDLAAARAALGDVPVIAVNGAAREVKAFALYSMHPERFVQTGYRWLAAQERLFGPGAAVHGSNRARNGPMFHVKHWWPELPGGGSAWAARKIAWLMGFDPVVLCGAPLDPGGYAGYKLGELMTQAPVIERYRQQIEADPEWHEGASSASGWTKQLLGGLP